MLAAADTFRAAAIEQLTEWSNRAGVEIIAQQEGSDPGAVVFDAIASSKAKGADVLLIDTAGRLHVDEEMMEEIKELHKVTNPLETLFVVDAMTGQDAANTAKAFNDALPLTGVILTKIDGDARGGAALSVRKITNCPIKFIGSGEKIEALEPFYPDRMASRILDMGDVLTLVEELERKVDKDKAAKMADKFKNGKSFTLEDYMEQIGQMRNMGGVMGIMSKLPGMVNLPDEVKDQINDKDFYRKEAIILSMTKKERQNPEIIKGSRRKRIALGAGVEISDVSKLIREFEMMQKVMRQIQGKGGIRKMMGLMKTFMGKGPFGGMR